MSALAVELNPLLGVPVGLSRTSDHLYYWRRNAETEAVGPIPSVTTIIKAVDRSGPLVGWAKRTVADTAIRNLDMLHQLRETGGDQGAIDWLKKLPDYERDTKADLGSRVHVLAEDLARGRDITVTEDELPYVTAYQSFLANKSPVFLAAEEAVVSLRHGYAGTLDAIAVIDGAVTLLDVKTGKGVYQETGLQLAAYMNAEFVGRPGDARRYRIPPIERCAVIHVRPEGYELRYFRVTPATFAAFLAAREVYGWLNGEAKEIMR